MLQSAAACGCVSPLTDMMSATSCLNQYVKLVNCTTSSRLHHSSDDDSAPLQDCPRRARGGGGRGRTKTGGAEAGEDDEGEGGATMDKKRC